MSAEVKVYSTTFCPYCVRAKSLLERKGVAFTEINLDQEAQMCIRDSQCTAHRVNLIRSIKK